MASSDVIAFIRSTAKTIGRIVKIGDNTNITVRSSAFPHGKQEFAIDFDTESRVFANFPFPMRNEGSLPRKTCGKFKQFIDLLTKQVINDKFGHDICVSTSGRIYEMIKKHLASRFATMEEFVTACMLVHGKSIVVNANSSVFKLSDNQDELEGILHEMLNHIDDACV